MPLATLVGAVIVAVGLADIIVSAFFYRAAARVAEQETRGPADKEKAQARKLAAFAMLFGGAMITAIGALILAGVIPL